MFMGYVYLIYDESNDVYKIGVTRSNNNRRIKRLQTGNSTQLRLIHIYQCEYPFRLEKMLHTKYKCNKVLNEWFELSGDDVINFVHTCNSLNNTIHLMKSNPFFAKNLV